MSRPDPLDEDLPKECIGSPTVLWSQEEVPDELLVVLYHWPKDVLDFRFSLVPVSGYKQYRIGTFSVNKVVIKYSICPVEKSHTLPWMCFRTYGPLSPVTPSKTFGQHYGYWTLCDKENGTNKNGEEMVLYRTGRNVLVEFTLVETPRKRLRYLSWLVKEKQKDLVKHIWEYFST